MSFTPCTRRAAALAMALAAAAPLTALAQAASWPRPGPT